MRNFVIRLFVNALGLSAAAYLVSIAVRHPP